MFKSLYRLNSIGRGNEYIYYPVIEDETKNLIYKLDDILGGEFKKLEKNGNPLYIEYDENLINHSKKVLNDYNDIKYYSDYIDKTMRKYYQLTVYEGIEDLDDKGSRAE